MIPRLSSCLPNPEASVSVSDRQVFLLRFMHFGVYCSHTLSGAVSALHSSLPSISWLEFLLPLGTHIIRTVSPKGSLRIPLGTASHLCPFEAPGSLAPKMAGSLFSVSRIKKASTKSLSLSSVLVQLFYWLLLQKRQYRPNCGSG